MSRIGIIYTTFLRDELMPNTVSSIIKNWNMDCRLLIGDQNPTDEKANLYADFIYYELPYDCGLSYARNFLIQKAYDLGCDYILMSADSIEFTQKYDFSSIIYFLESNPQYTKVGFNLNNRSSWEFYLNKTDAFILELSNDYIVDNNITYHKVDICRNFFLAKIKPFLEVPYDNDLKLLEHEDHCWRLKEAGYQTFSTNIISANYIDSKPKEYDCMRKRMYDEYNKILRKKYNLAAWLRYGEGVMEQIRKDRQCKLDSK